MATENIIMAVVKKGGDRQKAHEKIRVRCFWHFCIFFFQKEKSSSVRMACQCQDVSGTANSLGDQYRKLRSNTIHLLRE